MPGFVGKGGDGTQEYVGKKKRMLPMPQEDQGQGQYFSAPDGELFYLDDEQFSFDHDLDEKRSAQEKIGELFHRFMNWWDMRQAEKAHENRTMYDMPPQGPISNLGPRPPAREWDVGTAQELQNQGNNPMIGQKLFREYLERDNSDPSDLGIDAIGAIDDPMHIPKVRQIYAVKKHRM